MRGLAFQHFLYSCPEVGVFRKMPQMSLVNTRSRDFHVLFYISNIKLVSEYPTRDKLLSWPTEKRHHVIIITVILDTDTDDWSLNHGTFISGVSRN